MAKLDLSAVWADAMSWGRHNAELIAPVAGLFFALPAVAADILMKPMPALSEKATSAQQLAYFSEYATANWPVLVVHGLVTSFGALAIMALWLRAGRPTVAEALRFALLALPIYFLANILQSMMVVGGLFLFILPGLYLIGRLILIAPVAAAEGERNPLTLITRSIDLTRGHGWRIVALLAVIFVVGMIIGIVATSLAGILFTFLLPDEAARLGLSLVSALFEALFALAFVLTSAALYRGLATRAR